MSHNTIALNQQQALDHLERVWLFGYGSLIYKVDFPYLEKRPAYIEGWQRQFWQGSHDHRGTPDAPGRVLTLIKTPGAICVGMAYAVTPDVFEHLDHREKNGYLRFFTPLHWLPDVNHNANNSAAENAAETTAEGLVYVASPENEAFLGPAPLPELAQHIANSHGPSGANSEYLLRLDDALRELGGPALEYDQHIFALADAVRAFGEDTPAPATRERIYQVSSNRQRANHKLRYVESSAPAAGECKFCIGSLADTPADTDDQDKP